MQVSRSHLAMFNYSKKQWQDDFIDSEAAIDYFLCSNYLAILSDAENKKMLLENVYNFIKRR